MIGFASADVAPVMMTIRAFDAAGNQVHWQGLGLGREMAMVVERSLRETLAGEPSEAMKAAAQIGKRQNSMTRGRPLCRSFLLAVPDRLSAIVCVQNRVGCVSEASADPSDDPRGMRMQIVQWIVAAGTAVFVAAVGYFQWRTAQQKAALDLFDRRHEIYAAIRATVRQIVSQSQGFDQKQEMEFVSAQERAYFFFGDDVTAYLEKLWLAIIDVQAADSELRADQASADRKALIERRRKAFNVVAEFYKVGQPMFGRYMRFDHKVS